MTFCHGRTKKRLCGRAVNTRNTADTLDILKAQVGPVNPSAKIDRDQLVCSDHFAIADPDKIADYRQVRILAEEPDTTITQQAHCATRVVTPG